MTPYLLFSTDVPDSLFYVALLAAMAGSVGVRAITPSGAVAGGGIAIGIFAGCGWLGVALLAVFFVSGSVATRWRRGQKEDLGVAQEAGGQRSAVNALSNGAVAGGLGVLSWWLGSPSPWAYPMLMAALASATSDTLSSELGNLYGRRYWDMRSLSPGRRGADGVISLEGTLFGLLGSLLIALPAGLWAGEARAVWAIGAAGLLGNFSDTLLGASLQRNGWLSNHSTNFWSTLLAAVYAWLLWG